MIKLSFVKIYQFLQLIKEKKCIVLLRIFVQSTVSFYYSVNLNNRFNHFYLTLIYVNLLFT